MERYDTDSNKELFIQEELQKHAIDLEDLYNNAMAMETLLNHCFALWCNLDYFEAPEQLSPELRDAILYFIQKHDFDPEELPIGAQKYL